MSATSDLLGKKATAVISSIQDDAARERVLRAVLICDDALEVVDSLDLAPYELMDDGGADLSVWEALAPDVRNVLVAANGAGAQLAELFPSAGPPTSTLDVDFDLALDDDGLPAPIRDRREAEIDEIVHAPAEAVGTSIASLAAMLQHDFVQFGQRLRNPQVTLNRWFLLGELQELRMKCLQCLEAVVATILSAYTDEDLTTVMPRYATAARRAIDLRGQVVDLSHDVDRLNQALARATVEQASAIRHALTMRFNEFAEHSAAEHLRPQDKRAIIDFRRRLGSFSDRAEDLPGLKLAVEGISKFLEVMRAINEREVLITSDRSRLQTIRMLLESEVDLEELRGLLDDVYGRWPTLDELIRSCRKKRFPQPEDILDAVVEAQASIRE